jgi:hypothetical protein
MTAPYLHVYPPGWRRHRGQSSKLVARLGYQYCWYPTKIVTPGILDSGEGRNNMLDYLRDTYDRLAAEAWCLIILALAWLLLGGER